MAGNDIAVAHSPLLSFSDMLLRPDVHVDTAGRLGDGPHYVGLPVRAVWPASSQAQRASKPRNASSTDCGVGKLLSSCPWLWMAMRMSYSFTNCPPSADWNAWRADHHGHSRILAYSRTPDGLGVILVDVILPPAHDAQAGGLELAAPLGALFGSAVEER